MDFGPMCWSTELANAANGTGAADPGRLATDRRTNPGTCEASQTGRNVIGL